MNVDIYDAIVVGAGLSGATMAERMANCLGYRVLVVEQRNHIAGNCYDEKHHSGIMVHKYGPHLFHTDNLSVWNYLSKFTDWIPYQHRVVADYGGGVIPIPFNLNSLQQVVGPDRAVLIESKLKIKYGLGARVSINTLLEDDDQELRDLADWIYHNIFLNYTVRQWGVSPDAIDPSVLDRVPVVVSYDDRYFSDPYQAIPAKGYTKLVNSMLNNTNIDLILDEDVMDYLSLRGGRIYWHGKSYEGYVIYTGKLDQVFGYKYGQLPYRSLKFEFLEVQCKYYQAATTVNYPNADALTRVTEFKHILSEKAGSTIIVKEYPQEYVLGDAEKGIPYYPVFTPENISAFNKYKEEARSYERFLPIGRLAEYRYFDMDDAVANALNCFNKLYQAYLT